LLEGSFDTDPFRLLKVSDFLPVGEVPTRIVYAVNEKKKISQFQAQGPYQILEVIEPGSLFVGSVILEQPLDGNRTIKVPLTLATLFKSALAFYKKEKTIEDGFLGDIGISKISLDLSAAPCFLRLGRHSGAECVTIEGHRHIKIRQGRGNPPQYLDHATTFWLAAEAPRPQPTERQLLKPFGWTLLAEVTDDLANQFQAQEEAWRQGRREAPPAPVITPPPEEETPTPAPGAPAPATEVWEQATLTWNPGRQEITAAWQNRKAFGRGKDLVPESLQPRLIGRRKSVTARLTVEPVGNIFKIIKIEPAT